MKQRLIGAFLMLLISIPLIIFGGNYTLTLVVALSIISLYELFKVQENSNKYPLLLKLLGYLIVCYMILSKNALNYTFLCLIFILYLLPLVIINDKNKYNITSSMMMISSIIFTYIVFSLFLEIRNFGLEYLIYIILIAVITDIFAYATGNLVGTKHIFPKISPKKTLEGCIGGLLMGTFVSTIFYVDVINTNNSVITIIIMTALLSLLAQFGDLIFSSIKRYYNQKDFGNIIPGHGGILDRLDSIIFVLLGFKIVLSLI